MTGKRKKQEKSEKSLVLIKRTRNFAVRKHNTAKDCNNRDIGIRHKK